MDGFLSWLEPWCEALITVVGLAAAVGSLFGLIVVFSHFSERRAARQRRKQGPIIPASLLRKRPGDRGTSA